MRNSIFPPYRSSSQFLPHFFYLRNEPSRSSTGWFSRGRILKALEGYSLRAPPFGFRSRDSASHTKLGYHSRDVEHSNCNALHGHAGDNRQIQLQLRVTRNQETHTASLAASAPWHWCKHFLRSVIFEIWLGCLRLHPENVDRWKRYQGQ